MEQNKIEKLINTKNLYFRFEKLQKKRNLRHLHFCKIQFLSVHQFFGARSFCQIAISPNSHLFNCHFICFRSQQLAISSAYHFHQLCCFINLPIHQLVIWQICHFTNLLLPQVANSTILPFRQLVIQSTYILSTCILLTTKKLS